MAVNQIAYADLSVRCALPVARILNKPVNSYLTITRNFLVLIGTLLYVFGSYAHDPKFTKEMYIPLRLILKGDTLRH